ncbi:MAG: DUF167 domain-containing protein [Pseudomonadota bacterium]
MSRERDSTEEAITIDILVAPRASRERIGPVVGGRLKVAVTAPPVEGEANEAIVACLARAFGVAKSRIEIVQGANSRRKTVRVVGMPLGALESYATLLQSCTLGAAHASTKRR